MPQADTEALCETFGLAVRRTAAAEARHRSLCWLARYAVARQAAETAVLVVSELVTNAVVHSGSSLVTCTLTIDGSLLRVEVTDRGTSRTAPVVRHAAADEMTGRGLLMVSSVSQEWGASPAVPHGWTVWATVRTTV